MLNLLQVMSLGPSFSDHWSHLSCDTVFGTVFDTEMVPLFFQK